ncbi:MAG: hypothetical protein Q4G54_01505 [Pelistega sp.]|nr:hypothetical protein [Pelistega sp.]
MIDSHKELNRLYRILMVEASLILEHDLSITAIKVKNARKRLLKHIDYIGDSDELSLILATERGILQSDLDRYSNSKEMTSSLMAALNEFDSAERHLQLVQDKHEYTYVNLTHSLPKRRRAGLPMDEARQAFESHRTRLSNLNKARLDIEEKLIINARKTNIDKARTIYVQYQKAVLSDG